MVIYMIYNEFKGIKLSSLGLGCMRFPTTEKGNIDLVQTEELVDIAMKSGINYYDTAWVYHEGQSEIVIGELLKKYDRDTYYIASKFPGFDPENINRVEEIFETQLKKCQLDYFDFYLVHSVSDSNIDDYLNPKFRVYDYLVEQKKQGRIKYLGFSTHGSTETTERFIKTYGNELDFCQAQINWLDWKLQNAKEKIDLLKKYDIPCWVMEPLRGGKLCALEEKTLNQLNADCEPKNAIEWSFRFLQSIPQIKVVLSGMSNREQLEENIKIFSQYKPLNDLEFGKLSELCDEMMAEGTVRCTSCRYCTEHCPQKIDIPKMIDLYNDTFNFGKEISLFEKIASINEGEKPTDCISCSACETVCPQGIKISNIMQKIASRIEENDE